MVDTGDRRAGGKRFARPEGVPLAVQAILRQLRIDDEPEDVQRRVVARDATRGMFLPAELNALREAGWIDEPVAGASVDIERS